MNRLLSVTLAQVTKSGGSGEPRVHLHDPFPKSGHILSQRYRGPPSARLLYALPGCSTTTLSVGKIESKGRPAGRPSSESKRASVLLGDNARYLGAGAVLDAHDPVREMGEPRIVGDHHNGRLSLALELPDEIDNT